MDGGGTGRIAPKGRSLRMQVKGKQNPNGKNPEKQEKRGV